MCEFIYAMKAAVKVHNCKFIPLSIHVNMSKFSPLPER